MLSLFGFGNWLIFVGQSAEHMQAHCYVSLSIGQAVACKIYFGVLYGYCFSAFLILVRF